LTNHKVWFICRKSIKRWYCR